jgi:hypothetical protein
VEAVRQRLHAAGQGPRRFGFRYRSQRRHAVVARLHVQRAADAYRLLVHNGDADAARAALVKEGFGRLRIKLITCLELHSNKYELDYLIPGFYVAAQPCIVAGPKKALKTSLLIALAIALATGLPFLASFVVTRAVKVIMLSGESGMAVLQETARRICKSMGVSLPDD